MWGGHSCPPPLTLFLELKKLRVPHLSRSLRKVGFHRCQRPSRWQNPMTCGSSLAVKAVIASLLSLALVPLTLAQGDDSGQTMRPVIRGRHAAVATMKAEATEAARRILDAGGNAFDAAVGGQAALAVTDFSLNGIGSDAVLLVYSARDKKVYSVNAEPRAPKLATIEW